MKINKNKSILLLIKTNIKIISLRKEINWSNDYCWVQKIYLIQVKTIKFVSDSYYHWLEDENTWLLNKSFWLHPIWNNSYALERSSWIIGFIFILFSMRKYRYRRRNCQTMNIMHWLIQVLSFMLIHNLFYKGVCPFLNIFQI